MTDERAGGTRMPAAIRRDRILELVGREGFAAVSRIAGELGVSDMTVRRDLDALREQGRLDRTFGGAIRRELYQREEPAFDRRRRVAEAAKAAIADHAATLVGPSETIGLDVGTTTLALAERLRPRAGLKIFTSSLRAATALSGGASPVYVPGGQIREVELSIIGSLATAQLRNFFLDRVFIGVSGLTEAGLYDYSLEDTEVKRTLMAQAEIVVVLCDASKFERRSLALVARLHEVDVLVTDRPPPLPIAAALEAAGAEVAIARVEDGDEAQVM